MMNRVALKEHMMEQVNGGEYLLFTLDTDEFIASYTSRGHLENIIRKLNVYGMDLRVKTTNWMDDSDAEGEYRAADMKCRRSD